MGGEDGAEPVLPFAPGELDRGALRMRQSDFARLMYVSKQTASEWVKTGKITLGVDGLLDPRTAVLQLLRNTNGNRLRSLVVKPILRELRKAEGNLDMALKENERLMKRRGIELEAARAAAQEEGAAALAEWQEFFEEFRALVLAQVDRLAALPVEARPDALSDLESEAFDTVGERVLSSRSPLEGEAGA